jgi:predicted nucleotide-binding protein (sugar kinase/HSP70/actin superfamily)
MRIGIPRALFYYQYYPLLKTFFEQLGAEVVVSPPTTKDIVISGCSKLVSDICFPVKICCGHVLFLTSKCDLMFMPSIYSMEPKTYNCPKFIGLPDLIKSSISGCPPILAPEININNGKYSLYLEIYKVGCLFTRNPVRIKKAAEKAWQVQRTYQTQMQSTKFTTNQVIEEAVLKATETTKNNHIDSIINVALIGHPYLLHDEYINYRVVARLKQMGTKCLFPEMVKDCDLRSSLLELVDSPYWACEKEIIGAGNFFLRNGIDAIVSISAFGCGPDSLMVELLKREAKKRMKPFLNLVIDEHTAEEGIITRLEAFIDMTRRVKKEKLKSTNTYSPRKEKEQYKIEALGTPNFGYLSAALKSTAEKLNIRLIMPPVTKRTVSLGTKYSPEFVCIPFKIILGTFIEALESGANTLFMVTSSNACRMGYYTKVQEKILVDLGYDFQMLRFSSSEKGLIGVLKAIKRVSNDASWSTIISAYRLSTAKLKALDDIERKVQKLRPVELQKGTTDHIFKQAIRAIDETSELSHLKKVFKEYSKKLSQVPYDIKIIPLKVGIVGEIFVVMEPFINLDLEAKLGKLGVEVRRTRSTFFSEWTKFSGYNVLNEEKLKLQRFAEPYLKHDVGGHCLESVGEKIRHSVEYDGIIHLAPFTCMPEAIAQNIMLSTREHIPVLEITFDEQTGQTGLLTRVEAFVDLLERKRRQSNLLNH